MAKPMNFPNSRRFGSKYGKRIRDLHGKHEKNQRKSYKCPYCNKMSVKRLSVGIWKCKSCSKKFTSKAYEVKN